MEQKANFLALCLLDALEDEEERVVTNIMTNYEVDPSFVQLERGIAPLHYACGMPNERLAVDITRRFLEGNVNVNVRTADKLTPLHVAAMYGRVEIVKMLLQRGADLEVYDDERKTPVLYAIEECHFDVVQLMRDHIFEHKFELKKKVQQTDPVTQSKLEDSLHKRVMASPLRIAQRQASTPNRGQTVNKNLLTVTNCEQGGDQAKYTPNKIHYNYDVTSPYYINITHRRNKPQPRFPDEKSKYELNQEEMKENETSKEPDVDSGSVNIFTLTEENLKELSNKVPLAESSRLSLIETWRERVQRSRARASILKQFDDVAEMIESVMQNDHLNFTNTVLRSPKKAGSAEVDSGACGSASGVSSGNEDKQPAIVLPRDHNKMSLGRLIQKVAQAQLVDPEPETDEDSSYQTVPEVQVGVGKLSSSKLNVPDADTSNFIRSPKTTEYFLQMTEAYVHTDDENGLVFYETKLPRNVGNKIAQQRKKAESEKTSEPGTALNHTMTSQSTNFTLPADYETDALRQELTNFGDEPGPITKTTKRLYIKRLVKYKRKTHEMMELQKLKNSNATIQFDSFELRNFSKYVPCCQLFFKSKIMLFPTKFISLVLSRTFAQLSYKHKEAKFSVELYRTLRSQETFERISDFMCYEAESTKFFASNKNNKNMREGHLKQSFIYMLIDPRISCNLPGDSEFMDKVLVWRRFVESIFYVGKGKTSRPYSHLYNAMKTYTRINELQQKNCNEELINNNNISIKKKLNAELFKSPPKTTSESKKLDRILEIWGSSHGVVCLHVFHNILPTDAYTREAAIIEALSLQHLTNMKRGHYYGPAQTWTMKEKKYLGIALLYKALQIFLAEGESQLSPSDLI